MFGSSFPEINFNKTNENEENQNQKEERKEKEEKKPRKINVHAKNFLKLPVMTIYYDIVPEFYFKTQEEAFNAAKALTGCIPYGPECHEFGYFHYHPHTQQTNIYYKNDNYLPHRYCFPTKERNFNK